MPTQTTPQAAGNVSAKLNPTSSQDHTVAHVDPLRQRIWDHVSATPAP